MVATPTLAGSNAAFGKCPVEHGTEVCGDGTNEDFNALSDEPISFPDHATRFPNLGWRHMYDRHTQVGIESANPDLFWRTKNSWYNYHYSEPGLLKHLLQSCATVSVLGFRIWDGTVADLFCTGPMKVGIGTNRRGTRYFKMTVDLKKRELLQSFPVNFPRRERERFYIKAPATAGYGVRPSFTLVPTGVTIVHQPVAG